VVVRAPSTDIDLACGGAALLTGDATAPAGAQINADLAEGSMLGKRYAADDLGLELLCSRSGAGTLTCNGLVVEVKGAKPLPSSD
jgi:hypothetical protein